MLLNGLHALLAEGKHGACRCGKTDDGPGDKMHEFVGVVQMGVELRADAVAHYRIMSGGGELYNGGEHPHIRYEFAIEGGAPKAVHGIIDAHSYHKEYRRPEQHCKDTVNNSACTVKDEGTDRVCHKTEQKAHKIKWDQW